MAFNKGGVEAAVMAVGSGIVAGALISQWVSGEKFGGVAQEETKKYVAGQEFDREQFELDSLKGPVDKAVLEAVVRGGLRQYGEENATQPSPKARAIVLCAGAAANKLTLDDNTKNNFIAASQFEENNSDEAAERAFAVAADGCWQALDGALGGDLVFPVDDK